MEKNQDMVFWDFPAQTKNQNKDVNNKNISPRQFVCNMYECVRVHVSV